MYKDALLKFLRSLRRFGLLTEVTELDNLHHLSSKRPALIDVQFFSCVPRAQRLSARCKMELVKGSLRWNKRR